MEQEKQIHTEVVDIDDLIQDDHNFNKGTEAGAELIGRSFKEHGAGRSVFIDKNNRLVGGNKAQKGFKGAGYRKVVIVDSDPDTLVAVRRKDVDLDTKEGREMAMLDNLTTQVNLAWDKAELESISDQVEGFDVGDFGFEIDDLPQVVMPTGDETEEEAIERKRKEFEEKMAAGELDEDDPEYQEFVKKFEAKRTTDDCYTPDVVYDAVAEWVASEYNVSRANFVRPFYPGGDYQKERYKPTDIVVDNPPFSILAEITRFYKDHNVRFFLFAPRVSNLSVASTQGFTNICVGAGITYANGAIVPTSYITNLESEYIAKSSPSLYKAVTEANAKVLTTPPRELPRYAYPDAVVTAAMLSKYSKYDIEYGVKFSECHYTGELDAQKEVGKTIFAGGLLVNDKKAAEKAAAEKAAAEKAAATVWELSEREKAIIEGLNKKEL